MECFMRSGSEDSRGMSATGARPLLNFIMDLKVLTTMERR